MLGLRTDIRPNGLEGLHRSQRLYKSFNTKTRGFNRHCLGSSRDNASTQQPKDGKHSSCSCSCMKSWRRPSSFLHTSLPLYSPPPWLTHSICIAHLPDCPSSYNHVPAGDHEFEQIPCLLKLSKHFLTYCSVGAGTFLLLSSHLWRLATPQTSSCQSC
jgi:hypothetical protein